MTNEEIKNKLIEKFSADILSTSEPYGMLTLEISPLKNIDILQYCNTDLGFTFLNDLTVIHMPDEIGKEIKVVYMLQNITTSTRIRFKANLPIDNPSIATASTIYSTANWLEREAYDFFGVQFEGHPNLIRIMNVDEMNYFPLRKEFPLEDQTRSDKDDEMFGRDSYLQKK